MDDFEKTMRKKTHYWTNMMMRGITRHIVVIYHKRPDADQEPQGVHPSQYSSTFKDLEIFEKDQIKIVEMKKNFDDDMDDEEGEEEMEEQESEQEEDDEENGDKEETPAEKAPETNEVPESKPVENPT